MDIIIINYTLTQYTVQPSQPTVLALEITVWVSDAVKGRGACVLGHVCVIELVQNPFI